MLQLSEIHIYPVKSLGGIALQEAEVELRGLRHDRRWMLADADGRFVSQREIPGMIGLGTAIDAHFLHIFVREKPEERISVPLDDCLSETRTVSVWSDRFRARVYPESVNAWFSEQLSARLQLVFMPDTTRRRADGRYAPKGQYVSFADGYPYLIIGQASLDDLNSRLDSPVPMNRFRPNLVFTGGQAFEEDAWADFRIGDTVFRGVKPCGRCVMITLDQKTGARSDEPLRTLSIYRKANNKVLFGQNAVWTGDRARARIRVGDAITPLLP